MHMHIKELFPPFFLHYAVTLTAIICLKGLCSKCKYHTFLDEQLICNTNCTLI